MGPKGDSGEWGEKGSTGDLGYKGEKGLPGQPGPRVNAFNNNIYCVFMCYKHCILHKSNLYEYLMFSNRSKFTYTRS